MRIRDDNCDAKHLWSRSGNYGPVGVPCGRPKPQRRIAAVVLHRIGCE